MMFSFTGPEATLVGLTFELNLLLTTQLYRDNQFLSVDQEPLPFSPGNLSVKKQLTAYRIAVTLDILEQERWSLLPYDAVDNST